MNNEYVHCSITVNQDRTVFIHGSIISPDRFSSMEILAPNKIDRMTNMSGSGLPFPCPEIAFCNTPNHAVIERNGLFSVVFDYPNSYYTIDGKTKIAPTIFFILKQSNGASLHLKFELTDDLFLRTLTYRPNFHKGPIFYSAKEELIGICSAEETMRRLKEYKTTYDIA